MARACFVGGFVGGLVGGLVGGFDLCAQCPVSRLLSNGICTVGPAAENLGALLVLSLSSVSDSLPDGRGFLRAVGHAWPALSLLLLVVMAAAKYA